MDEKSVWLNQDPMIKKDHLKININVGQLKTTFKEKGN
jgi:hypothetical protein